MGKIWAEKILSSDRSKYNQELERLKSYLSSDVEKLKSQLALNLEISKRFSEKQFYLYNELWSSLCDLRITGDNLWENATQLKVKRFAKQFKKTEDQILRSSLLIENGHYERLRELMNQFSKFKHGKTRLIDLKDHPAAQINLDDINQIIEDNREVKDDYSRLLEEIETYFKNQIQGIN